jgi:hypothetical protein
MSAGAAFTPSGVAHHHPRIHHLGQCRSFLLLALLLAPLLRAARQGLPVTGALMMVIIALLGLSWLTLSREKPNLTTALVAGTSALEAALSVDALEQPALVARCEKVFRHLCVSGSSAAAGRVSGT